MESRQVARNGSSSNESPSEGNEVRRRDQAAEKNAPALTSSVEREGPLRRAESPLTGGDDDDDNKAFGPELDNASSLPPLTDGDDNDNNKAVGPELNNDSSLWTRAADFTTQHKPLMLAIAIATILAATWTALVAFLPPTCPYGEKTRFIQPPAPVPPILELPPTVRPADEDAFDRIAMMLPANWVAWLVDPPYLSAADTQYPRSSIRDAHRGLGHLVRNNPWRDQDSQPLYARIRYSNRFDDLDSEYFHDLEHGWLRDAAQCWSTPLVGWLYCPVRHPGAVALAQESIINPLDAYVGKELDFLQTALSLLSALEASSTEQQADILMSLRSMLTASARRSFPLDLMGESSSPGGSNIDLDHKRLMTVYEHYAQASFFELACATVKPEIQFRIDRLQAFQQKIQQQRQSLLESPSTIPAFYRQTLDWLANDAAYALRSNTFANATTMRQTACTWTLTRLPLRDDDDDGEHSEEETAHLHRQHLFSIRNPPPLPQRSVLRRALMSLIPYNAGAPRCKPRPTPQEELTQLRTSQVQTHNALLHLLWLSKTAAPSVRWHWEEGGSKRLGWEAKLEKEWKLYVQRKMERVMEGVGEEDGGVVLSRMVPRGDRGSLQWSWPGIRTRKECATRHGRDDARKES